jgi:hypothetical protein
MKSVQDYIKVLENIEMTEEDKTEFFGPFTAGELIQILRKVDPNTPIQMTMNEEYQDELGRVDISGDYVTLDDH